MHPKVKRIKEDAEAIVKLFIEDYFGEDIDDVDDIEYDAIGGDIFSVIVISDMYINFSDIMFYLENAMSPETFSNWYWETAEKYGSGEQIINLQSYYKGLRYESVELHTKL